MSFRSNKHCILNEVRYALKASFDPVFGATIAYDVYVRVFFLWYMFASFRVSDKPQT